MRYKLTSEYSQIGSVDQLRVLYGPESGSNYDTLITIQQMNGSIDSYNSVSDFRSPIFINLLDTEDKGSAQATWYFDKEGGCLFFACSVFDDDMDLVGGVKPSEKSRDIKDLLRKKSLILQAINEAKPVDDPCHCLKTFSNTPLAKTLEKILG